VSRPNGDIDGVAFSVTAGETVVEAIGLGAGEAIDHALCEIHTRIPVIVPDERHDAWLAESLKPFFAMPQIALWVTPDGS
jgi:putative SOS response-associated peptidase YedK